MKVKMFLPAVLTMTALALPADDGKRFNFDAPNYAGLQWFKGNTHAHTTMSDGDSSPEVVAKWYKDHGYNFFVLSDHNVFTDPAALANLVGTEFIGSGGKILLKTESNPAIYRLSGNESYVRAKVYDSAGFVAWTQPVFVKQL